MENAISLFELNQRIRELIKSTMSESFWIIAEISELRINSSGHCYLELVEKDPDTEGIKARARATIWSYTFRILKPYFETTTNRQLETGLKILVKCQVEFHEVYGLSLNISDIDPTYTIGELAKRRMEIIRQLEKDGILHMNRELQFPVVPQKIAIISSSTAAGYEDFTKHLDTNEARIRFYYKLFPAYMQGSEAESSIIKALERIYKYEHFFDTTVIIRGGGSQADLSCFDSYDLAYHITQFPIPVITGIGHERDESVTDMVAHKQLKTPTAVAGFLISRCVDFSNYLHDTEEQVVNITLGEIERKKTAINTITLQFSPLVQKILNASNRRIDNASQKFGLLCRKYLLSRTEELKSILSGIRHTSKNLININKINLNNQLQTIPIRVRNSISKHHKKLDIHSNTADFLNPGNVLKRGYSITFAKGKVIKSANDIEPGDSIITRYHKGESLSKVEKVK
ncbi:MAG: exodeoxyribonuclease VII large subunit [Bacteroidales bacterium]|nr:MAG: exodeoxyribonuclease VII large subunit [Bacteroidales bacterium]